jgi:hypothetical protein
MEVSDFEGECEMSDFWIGRNLSMDAVGARQSVGEKQWIGFMRETTCLEEGSISESKGRYLVFSERLIIGMSAMPVLEASERSPGSISSRKLHKSRDIDRHMEKA